MIDAYTKFCSQKDATDRTFQELNQTNVPYQNFIKVRKILPEILTVIINFAWKRL